MDRSTKLFFTAEESRRSDELVATVEAEDDALVVGVAIVGMKDWMLSGLS